MATFHLSIASLDGSKYDGEVTGIRLRTIDGDVAILSHHMNYCSAVAMGTATITFEDGTERSAACIGGMISMMKNVCRVLPTTWEWSDEIDVERAEKAKDRATKALEEAKLSEESRIRNEAKLYRALVRLSAAKIDNFK